MKASSFKIASKYHNTIYIAALLSFFGIGILLAFTEISYILSLIYFIFGGFGLAGLGEYLKNMRQEEKKEKYLNYR